MLSPVRQVRTCSEFKDSLGLLKSGKPRLGQVRSG
jgi:hypothetical protein